MPAIAEICQREKVWLHVDGAYGGMLAIVPEYRGILDGVELADSLVVNPHKWLFTPFECSLLLLKRPEILKRAFSLVPEYLVTREQDEVVNYMDYGVQLGRRFRALKLWMMIRAFGVDRSRRATARPLRARANVRDWVESERRLGADGAGSLLARLLSLRAGGHERRRVRSPQRSDHARGERRRRRVSLAHQAARTLYAAPGDRQHPHRGAPRRARVGAAARGGDVDVIPSVARDPHSELQIPRCARDDGRYSCAASLSV